MFKEFGEEISEEELREYFWNIGIKNLCENFCNFEKFRYFNLYYIDSNFLV